MHGTSRVAGGLSMMIGAILAVTTLSSPVRAQSPASARQIVGHAIDLMGGEATLRGVERVRMRTVTQWQRIGFRDVPWTDRPSFESDTEVRDYTIPAWRNTRTLGTRTVIDLIRDSVAVIDLGAGFRPLSIAYVDERDESFMYTPDRLVLLLADARDLTRAPDTLIGGEPHNVVIATLSGSWRVRVFFQAGSGLPTLLRFRAAQPNDFGLVAWGRMDVEVWYSNWASTDGINFPAEWDIIRVGRPYKRITIQGLEVNPEFAADSFAVADSLRERFIAARGPMHDVQVDSAILVNPRIATVSPSFGFPAGAVRAGDWYLLEAAHHPLMLRRARKAMSDVGMGRIAGAIVVAARSGNGGVVALVDEGVPLFVAPAAEPFIRKVLEGAGRSSAGIDVVREGRWIGTGGERIRLEPVDLADSPGSLLIYSPDMGWLFAPDAATPLDIQLVKERAKALGWQWSALGTARGVVVEGKPES